MRVFLSWSGEYAKAIALELRTWLPGVLQELDPWMSDVDIEPGSRWSPEIAKALEDATFGILCVTPDNRSAPWLVFEAGALTNHMGSEADSRVVPLLIGLTTSDVTGPLAQLNMVEAHEKGVRKLIGMLNAKLAKPNAPAVLERVVRNMWPDLAKALEDARATHAALKAPEPRKERDID